MIDSGVLLQVYNGLERSVPLSLGYKPRLIDPVDKFDNTSVLADCFYLLFSPRVAFSIEKGGDL